MKLTKVKKGHEKITDLGGPEGMLYQHKREWRFRLIMRGVRPVRGAASTYGAALRAIIKAAKELKR